MTTSTAATLADQLRALRAQASGAVPGGLMAWWGSFDLPDGDEHAPVLDRTAWESVYRRVENAALRPGVVLALPQLAARSFDRRADEPLPIAIVDVPVAVPDARFVERVRAAAKAGSSLEEPLPALKDLLHEQHVFAAAGFLHDQWLRAEPVVRGRQLSLVYDPAFHVTLTRPDKVEVDLGDGFQVAEPFVPIRPRPVSEAAVRVTTGDTQRVARFSVALSDDPAPPAADEVWPLTGGRAWVWRAPGHTDIVNPVVLVEGFPGGHPADYLYELLDQHGLATRLRGAGYDLVVVGLANGMQPIEANVTVLGEAVAVAQRRTTRPLVIGGVSMGGLISRLALAEAEAAGIDHRARAYLSIDAPHRGTYTSLGVQWFVQALKALAPTLVPFSMLLDSPANQQLMLAYLTGGTVGESPLRAPWMQTLSGAGQPQRPRRLGVACGRGDGKGLARAGVSTLSWIDDPLLDVELFTLPGRDGVIADGHWLGADPPLAPLQGNQPFDWETVPGSLNTYNAQAAAVARGFGQGQVASDAGMTCGVPTISALDLDGDPTAPVAADAGPWHAHACSPSDAQHLELAPETVDWIVEQLGTPPGRALARGSHERFDPYAFDPHDPVFSNDPYPTYAWFRNHAPSFEVWQYGSRWFFHHADCKAILDDKDTFVKWRGGPAPGPMGVMRAYEPGVFSSDPPRHDWLRGILEGPFAAMLPQAGPLTTQIGEGLLAGARRRGAGELVMDFALPVPAAVVLTLLGIPDDAQHTVTKSLLAWQALVVRLNDPTTARSLQGQGVTAAMALHQYLAGLVHGWVASGGGQGLIGALCEQVGKDGLAEEDVAMCCFDFVMAGYLSTTYLIASAVKALAEHPDQRARLTDAAAIEAAVGEVLRYEPPLQLIDRMATADTQVGEVAVRKGDKVTAVVASANRDPAAFPDHPDGFDATRDTSALLTFGDGIHRCIGEPLARTITPPALELLLASPAVEPDGTPQWQTDPYLRGLVNLPVRY